MIEWETGEFSREPITIIATDDTITCVIYAKNRKYTRDI